MYLLIALLVGVLFGSVAHSQGAENFDEFTLRTPDRGVLTQDRVHPPHRDSSWERNLVEHLRRHKRYPSEALSRREEGTVLLGQPRPERSCLGAPYRAQFRTRRSRQGGYGPGYAGGTASGVSRDYAEARLDITIPIRFSVGTNAVSGLEQFKPVDTAPNLRRISSWCPPLNPSIPLQILHLMGVISDSSHKKGDLGTCYSPWMMRQIKNIKPEILEVDNGKIV